MFGSDLPEGPPSYSFAAYQTALLRRGVVRASGVGTREVQGKAVFSGKAGGSDF